MDMSTALVLAGAGATGGEGAARLIGWGAGDVPMLVCLPVLLVCSGFFSGSETALFGLTEGQRMSLSGGKGLVGRAVERLLRNQRMLLITILLGNTAVNVLYFVMISVLLMRSTSSAVTRGVLAGVFLLLIVVLGEIGPKVLANASRARFISLTAPLLLPLHEAIGPIRVALANGVIGPLSRLVAPERRAAQLHDEELEALLDVSRNEGVIESEEQRILRDVLRIRQMRVRDVMTPRVRMQALSEGATRAEVLAMVRESRLSQIPIYREDLDDIAGILHVKRYLPMEQEVRVTDGRVLTAAEYVPDVASLDQLLEHLRRTGRQSAIVVDEYGGTEGIVSMEDMVEELVGDIVSADEEPSAPPRLIGLGKWRVSGDESVRDWMEGFGVELEGSKAATVAGLITERLGRVPTRGDIVDFGTVEVEVERVGKRTAVSVIVTLREEERDEREGAGGEGSR